MGKIALSRAEEVESTWQKVREARKRTLETLRETVKTTCDLVQRAVEDAVEAHPELLLASSPGTRIKKK